jgi:phosphoglycolate phosphatase
MFNTILFDFDGVLIDGSAGLERTLAWIIAECGLRKISREETDTFFRLSPLQRSFAEVFGFNTVESQRLCDIFRNHFKRGECFNARLYDSGGDVLKNLKSQGFRLGIASFKREDYLLKIVHHFGIGKYFDTVCGADSDNKLTKADLIAHCIGCMDVVPNTCVYVGDTANDAKAAAEVGITFIAAVYGFGFRNTAEATVYNPTAVLHDINELPTVVKIKSH